MHLQTVLIEKTFIAMHLHILSVVFYHSVVTAWYIKKEYMIYVWNFWFL